METSMLLTATKEFTWDMAHMLAEHEGLCKNLHGHTYKLLVTVARKHELVEKEGPAAGMVIDFKKLKEIVKEVVVDPLDHCLMININSTDAFELQLWELAENQNKKVVQVPYRATAENMVKDFFFKIQSQFSANMPEVCLVKLRLYETPTSYAEVSL